MCHSAFHYLFTTASIYLSDFNIFTLSYIRVWVKKIRLIVLNGHNPYSYIVKWFESRKTTSFIVERAYCNISYSSLLWSHCRLLRYVESWGLGRGARGTAPKCFGNVHFFSIYTCKVGYWFLFLYKERLNLIIVAVALNGLIPCRDRRTPIPLIQFKVGDNYFSSFVFVSAHYFPSLIELRFW